MALEALIAATPVKAKDPQMQADAINALRTALADQSEQALEMVIAPPQRKPLTDEEILKMWDDTRNDPIAPSVFCLIACVRHVEQAHGIGGEE
jgi:hypothetical protein